MRTFLTTAIGACLLIAMFCGARTLKAGETSASSGDNGPAKIVDARLAKLETWLGKGANGDKWRSFLQLASLREQLAKGAEADPAAIADVWKQFASGQAGLELAPPAEVRAALAAWWQELAAPSAEKLPAAVKSAGGLFTPISAAMVATDKAALSTTIQALEKYLASANGAGWTKYLGLADLQKQLQAEAPNPADLLAIEKRFFADHAGLEMPVFSNAGAALRRYRQSVEAAADTDLQNKFNKQLEELAADLTTYQSAPDEPGSAKVAGHLQWLAEHHQAPLLVAAVRQYASRPNLLVEVSESLAALGVNRAIDEPIVINDQILQTAVTGTGRTVGSLSLDFVPSDTQAVMHTGLVAVTTSKTVGRSGPATIWATGTTLLTGSSRVEVDASGIRWLPAITKAHTSTSIDGVQAGRGRGLIQGIAEQKVQEGKGLAEQVSSTRAAERLRTRLGEEVAKSLTKANANYLAKIRNPLLRRHEFPSPLNFSTTEKWMYIRGSVADARQLAAPTAPPELEIGHALAVQMHESAVNNLTAALLAGVTFTQEEVQQKVIEWRGSLPEQLKTDEDREPWSITFAAQRPVSLSVVNDGFQITVRGQGFTSGERQFKAMNVTAIYKVEQQGRGARLVRQGDLQIFPPGFVEGKSKFSIQETALRSLLQKRFGKLFEKEIAGDGLALPGNWKRFGKLPLEQLTVGGGWVVLGWRKPMAEPAPPAAKTAAAAAGLMRATHAGLSANR